MRVIAKHGSVAIIHFGIVSLMTDLSNSWHGIGQRHVNFLLLFFRVFTLCDIFNIAIGCAEIEAVIGVTAIFCHFVFICERGPYSCLRIDVRHVHEARYAACRRRGRLRRKVALVRQAGLAKVDLVIDHSRHQVPAVRVDDFDAVVDCNLAADFLDSLTMNQHVGVANLTLVDQASVTDEQFFQTSISLEVLTAVCEGSAAIAMPDSLVTPAFTDRGKVRDTYPLSDGRLLMVATDRISAFDVVLPKGIPGKGIVLNRMSAFWFEQTRHLITNHFIMLADDPEATKITDAGFAPSGLPPEIAKQAMVVKRAERLDIECIVRGYITGSAWAEYRKSGTVSGKQMPVGLLEGQAFPELLFTPTTKAEVGHDENMSDEQVLDMVGAEMAGKLAEASKTVYKFACDYALERGIILADTKMEFGTLDGELILIDELLTPDSSRFWDVTGYEPGRSQPNFDKQFVRDWLSDQGWDREPPAPELPDDVAEKTTERYREAFFRLTGQRI